MKFPICYFYNFLNVTEYQKIQIDDSIRFIAKAFRRNNIDSWLKNRNKIKTFSCKWTKDFLLHSLDRKCKIKIAILFANELKMNKNLLRLYYVLLMIETNDFFSCDSEFFSYRIYYCVLRTILLTNSSHKFDIRYCVIVFFSLYCFIVTKYVYSNTLTKKKHNQQHNQIIEE